MLICCHVFNTLCFSRIKIQLTVTLISATSKDMPTVWLQIFEAYNSRQFIKNDDSNKTTWSIVGGQFTADKTGLVTFSLLEFNLKKQISWVFHVDDRSKASKSYDMIISYNLIEQLGIILNLNFNDKTVIWDTETILIETSSISNPKDWRHDPFHGRIHLCYSIGFTHGILSHQVICWCPKAIYHYIYLGKIKV